MCFVIYIKNAKKTIDIAKHVLTLGRKTKLINIQNAEYVPLLAEKTLLNNAECVLLLEKIHCKITIDNAEYGLL